MSKDNQDQELIFVGGVDLTTKNPQIMQNASCIKARYDAGVTNHDKDNTGVIEVWVRKR